MLVRVQFIVWWITVHYSKAKHTLLSYFKRNSKVLKEVTPFIFEKSKIQSKPYNSIIDDWISLRFENQTIITLTNINVEAKNIEFWAKIPVEHKIKFMDDLVLLRCKDKRELFRLMSNIDHNFAEARGYIDGEYVITNLEEVY